jgi:hypothetical protein
MGTDSDVGLDVHGLGYLPSFKTPSRGDPPLGCPELHPSSEKQQNHYQEAGSQKK